MQSRLRNAASPVRCIVLSEIQTLHGRFRLFGECFVQSEPIERREKAFLSACQDCGVWTGGGVCRPSWAHPQTILCKYLLPYHVWYMMNEVDGQRHGLLLLKPSPSSRQDFSREENGRKTCYIGGRPPLAGIASMSLIISSRRPLHLRVLPRMSDASSNG